MSLKTPRNTATKDLEKPELTKLVEALKELNSDVSMALYSLGREMPIVDLRTVEELLNTSNRHTHSLCNELKVMNKSLERLADYLCQNIES